MGKYLFDMSDSEIDSAVEAHYDRMYEDYYGDNGECCKYCYWRENPYCTYNADEEDDDEDLPVVDDDYWCEHFECYDCD